MTAAISAASTPFSCDCWRMMSSWWRGRVSSRSTWSTSPTTPSRRPPGDADGDDGDPDDPPPHSLRVSIRADSERSRSSTVPSLSTTCAARSAFSPCDSWRASRSPTSAWPRASARERRRLLGGDDGDGGVEDALHLGLEQQRDLDHGDLGILRAGRRARRRSARRRGGGSGPRARSAARDRRRRSRRCGGDRPCRRAPPRGPSARPGGRAAARSRAARGRRRRWRSSPRRAARTPPAPRTSRPRCRR